MYIVIEDADLTAATYLVARFGLKRGMLFDYRDHRSRFHEQLQSAGFRDPQRTMLDWIYGCQVAESCESSLMPAWAKDFIEHMKSLRQNLAAVHQLRPAFRYHARNNLRLTQPQLESGFFRQVMWCLKRIILRRAEHFLHIYMPDCKCQLLDQCLRADDVDQSRYLGSYLGKTNGFLADMSAFVIHTIKPTHGVTLLLQSNEPEICSDASCHQRKMPLMHGESDITDTLAPGIDDPRQDE